MISPDSGDTNHLGRCRFLRTVLRSIPSSSDVRLKPYPVPSRESEKGARLMLREARWFLVIG